MIFWGIVGVAVLLLLVFAWRSDRRHPGSKDHHIPGPQDDPAVGEAKAARYIRNIGGMGTGPGGAL